MLTGDEQELIVAADDLRLTVSGKSYLLDRVELDVNQSRLAADLVFAGLLYEPGFQIGPHRAVRATTRGLAAVGREPVR